MKIAFDDIYLAVRWPDTQRLMSFDGFFENSEPLQRDPGAYLVSISWIQQLAEDKDFLQN